MVQSGVILEEKVLEGRVVDTLCVDAQPIDADPRVVFHLQGGLEVVEGVEPGAGLRNELMFQHLYYYYHKRFTILMFKEVLLTFCSLILAHSQQIHCDILIGGGTLASLGAAIHAPPNLRTCLVEPTSRLGGQMGEEGVWHIDFNWLYQAGYPDRTIAYNPGNIHPLITQVTAKCNTGECWVSRNCFEYSCIEPIIKSHLATRQNLTIFYDSMIKSVQRVGTKISTVEIITRLPLAEKVDTLQDCRSVDEVIEDWYTREPSQYYRKNVSKLSVTGFVIEGTQYGDLLALSNATFMQGIPTNQNCGQSIVFCFQQQYPINAAANSVRREENIDNYNFSLGNYTSEQVWRYRRLVGKGTGIKAGQISLQNWDGPGNDYRAGYLFADAKSTVSNWKGGLNGTTLRQAEKRSLAFHEWFKSKSGAPLELYKNETKTCKGLNRFPYIRDGRRSVGYQNFTLKNEDVTGVYKPGGSLTATAFHDRASIGMYNMDLHSLDGCQYGPFPQAFPLPFFLPLRAYSNRDVSNLIVSGRAMAQQFFVSSATRTPTTEIASGAASMVMATFMMGGKIPSTWALIDCEQCLPELQNFLRQVVPLEWTINGKEYPEVAEQQR